MIDRGIIKWQPFNSCMEPNKIIKDIKKQKSRYTLPTLSEEQLQNIGEKIIDAYNLKLIVKLQYYFDGNIYETTGKINYLSIPEKKICINNKFLYFKQLLNIDF
ncbi:MAG: YolD-like family protein [Clostridiales bacterium]|nr:YolD-like family protein [Clostridiales bacterium]